MRFDIPVSDLERAKRFYTEKLGLVPTHENPHSCQFRRAENFFVLAQSESAGEAQHSLLTWLVKDIITEKKRLEENAVIFEDYGYEGPAKAVAQLGEDLVAWFKDSEGNLLAIAQLAT